MFASAQADIAPPRPLVTVTPYTGVRVPFNGGPVTIGVPSGNFLVRAERSGSPILGADVRLRLYGPLGIVLGGAFSQSGEVDIFLSDTAFHQTPDWVAESSDAMYFARLGLSARVDAPRSIVDTRRRPSTEFVAAAGMVREFGEYHPALNLGFQGILPLTPGVEFVAGVEDYVVFWDESKVAPTLAGIVGSFQSEPVQSVSLHYDTSHILGVRVGVSLYHW